jgi:hypothetical protein
MPGFIDYTGKKIGRITFNSHYLKAKKNRWKCTCDCGSQVEYKIDWLCRKLKNGHIFECKECYLKRKNKVEINAKYGRWTVIKEVPSVDNHHTWFLCRCECGVEKEIVGTSLTCKRKPSKSCGCYARKLESKWVNDTQYPPAHGLKSRVFKKIERSLYCIRNNICARCYRKEYRSYKLCGAKGHTVCDLWKNGAKAFVDWAIKNNFQRGDTVCLQVGEKEWCPENCFIVKKSILISQNNSKIINWRGKKKNISEWAKEIGVSIACLSRRLQRYAERYGLDKAMDKNWVPPYKRTYINDHLENEIVRLYQEGKTFVEINEQLGCQSSTVKRFLTKNKISPRPAKARSSIKKP